MSVKFAAEIAGKRKLIVKDKYRLTARGNAQPAVLTVSITAEDIFPIQMNERRKTLAIADDRLYGLETVSGLFEKDIVRFRDEKGDLQVGEVFYDESGGLHCLRTSEGKTVPLFAASDRLVIGSALLGDTAAGKMAELTEEPSSPETGQSGEAAGKPAEAGKKEVLSIYTDGSCIGNPGPCGAGYVVVDRDGTVISEASLPLGRGTNNIAELTAMTEALRYACSRCRPGKLMLYSDSEYLLKGLKVWSSAWIENDWHTSSGKPVKNMELWKDLLVIYEKAKELFRIELRWVKGHDGNRWNERADRLAADAAAQAAKETS